MNDDAVCECLFVCDLCLRSRSLPPVNGKRSSNTILLQPQSWRSFNGHTDSLYILGTPVYRLKITILKIYIIPRNIVHAILNIEVCQRRCTSYTMYLIQRTHNKYTGICKSQVEERGNKESLSFIVARQIQLTQPHFYTKYVQFIICNIVIINS